jgi:hypothetical protein
MMEISMYIEQRNATKEGEGEGEERRGVMNQGSEMQEDGFVLKR